METSILLAIVVCGLAAAAVVLLAALRKKSCPDCGHELPRFRKPRTLMQALWGGWTCPHCQAVLDRSARKVIVK